ncbi:MAG: bacteriocin-protection protein [Gammaproteobacteria bacterium]|nr:bacteriocin-protection protein [Gammaproteobacteria bacterium]
MEDATPHFFPTPADLRAWFEANHDKVDVMWVGYYKKATKLPSVTVPESVDLALCYGWIDGLKRTVDAKAYKIRFTPRRRRSHWSARNLARMKQLLAQGVVTQPGLAAYERRDKERRLGILIESSAGGKVIPLMRWMEKPYRPTPGTPSGSSSHHHSGASGRSRG